MAVKKNFSLWGDEILQTKVDDEEVIRRIGSPEEVDLSKLLKNKKITIQEKLVYIKRKVYEVLKDFIPNTLIIYDINELHDYITKCINNGLLGLDTETNNSVDPLTCKLMGVCLYTPGQKQVYVPINHRDPTTKKLLPNQLTEEQVAKELARLSKTRTAYHNAKFDYEVLWCTCDVKMRIDDDTFVGAYVIDESDDHGLKPQYVKHINPRQLPYDIEKLFGAVPYEFIPPEIFGIYSAADPKETIDLLLWQEQFFSLPENQKLYKLYKEVEMPLVEVTASMELNGIEFDTEYAERLRVKYEPLRDSILEQAMEEISEYNDVIEQWKLTPEATYKELKVNENGKRTYTKSKLEQLDNPISLSSPTQLAILLYDILKLENGDFENPRSTGIDALEYIVETYNIKFTKSVLKFREFEKLVNTYINKLPNEVGIDGRVHCSFNQCGTDTGRYSSSSPNLQNIPSGNRELRLLFRANTHNGEPYMLIGGDFSAQEPRLTAFYSKEPAMKQAFLDKKDLYSVIAQNIYNNNYEDNLEFYPEGTHIMVNGEEVVCGYKTHQSKEGKERRKHGKTLQLALTYGMGAKSVGEKINKSTEEGQKLMDNFFIAFPKLKKWIEYNNKFVREHGYVEDFYGRRRHLNNINLPPYEAKYLDKEKQSLSNFNPFFECEDRESPELLEWVEKCKNAWGKKAFEKLEKEAYAKGIKLVNNSSKIAAAQRQTTNAIVQGGAATITKIAMNNIYRDQELKDLGFKLLITVHDEVLGECPKRNAEKAQKRLAQVMIDSAKPFIDVPMACDCYVVPCWYYDELTTQVQEEVEKLVNGDKDKGILPIPRDEAIKQIRAKHIELLDSQFNDMLELN